MKTILKSILLFLCIGVASTAFSQYKYVASESSMVIFGTSNVHDWEETCNDVTGTLNLTLDGNEIDKITGISMNIPVKSIKSGKGGMDDNTYKALKEKEHPIITYKIKSFGVTEGKVHLTGTVTVAGVTKEIKFPAAYTVSGDQISFKGTANLKMTDFGVDPPTAVMGTIKCGDDLKFEFDIVFKK